MQHRNLEQEFKDIFDEDSEDDDAKGNETQDELTSDRQRSSSQAIADDDQNVEADGGPSQSVRLNATKRSHRLSSSSLDISAEAVHASLSATAQLGQHLQQLHERVVRMLGTRKSGVPEKCALTKQFFTSL